MEKIYSNHHLASAESVTFFLLFFTCPIILYVMMSVRLFVRLVRRRCSITLPFHFNIWNHIDINFIIITNCCTDWAISCGAYACHTCPKKSDSGAIESSK